MKLNEFLEKLSSEVDYDLYHKLDEMYGDEDLCEASWVNLLIIYGKERD